MTPAPSHIRRSAAFAALALATVALNGGALLLQLV